MASEIRLMGNEVVQTTANGDSRVFGVVRRALLIGFLAVLILEAWLAWQAWQALT